MACISTQEFWHELKKLLDLPDEVYELTLKCKCDELVTLELKTYAIPVRIEDGEIVKEIKRYNLVGVDDEAT